ncbi:putative double substrate-specificity short chain dehydrogenase reductase 2 [Rosellinia necatrix]|uniref:Putative double substrate-specificity short chain dehydrogenase reductase 2 n=1 Tax=Rosellinia necatrix TaxID=77044 RepID=A0A1W2TNL6_ROSNE|nr:putative double substrate-specificity short chain dehydrogenase reductase 2 [Rosellinia necatrix]
MIPTTTHPEFNAKTEALEVAAAFSERIRGKTILVTGGNPDGIGFTTCQAFASQSPAHLIIAGRTPAKLERCIALLRAEHAGVDYRALHVDLSSQASVRAAAARVLAWADVPALDVVVNSAGVMGVAERTLSEDGIELHLATNHVGHFLLTCALMPKLLVAAAARGPQRRGATRIVNVSSASPQIARGGVRWSDLGFERASGDLPEAERPDDELARRWGYGDVAGRAYVGLEAYNVSKVANVLFGVGANRRLYDAHGILSLAVHPGVIPTELARNFPPENLAAIDAMLASGLYEYKTLGAGAATTLVAALDPRLGPGVTRHGGGENYGVYLDDCQISDKALPCAVSSAEAERLWKVSEELVKETFEW